jgi:hypothetical protein
MKQLLHNVVTNGMERMNQNAQCHLQVLSLQLQELERFTVYPPQNEHII